MNIQKISIVLHGGPANGQSVQVSDKDRHKRLLVPLRDLHGVAHRFAVYEPSHDSDIAFWFYNQTGR